MNKDEKNFQANLAVLENFKKDPVYKLYWENWQRAQNWANHCERTYRRFQDDLPDIDSENGLNSLLDFSENHQMDFQPSDVPEDEDDEMAEYYNITIQHKKEMEERKKKQQEEEALLPQVEYVDATEIGIHGINSANVDRQTFRSRVQEHLKKMEELYGPHAEKIVTMESTMTVDSAKPGFKPTEVAKVIEPFVDEANLLIVDRDPEEDKTTIPSSETLLSKTRDNVQCLFNKIWQLKRTIVKDAVCAELPEKETYRLPREKPIPPEKQLTKWEQFAKEKGIQKRKKDKKVYDEATGEWKPTYGYRRAKDETKDWLIELNDQQDPNKDYFAERVQKKKERIAKNKYQQMKNEARAMKTNGMDVDGGDIPIGVGGRTELASKDQLTYQIHKTKVSTASAGKFEPTMKGEKKPKLGIKRKFEPNENNMKNEKENQLKILSNLNAKKSKIAESRIAASEQAIQKAVVAETGENSAARREKKKPKGRSNSAIHRQQHYQAKKKGKAPPPKRTGKFNKGGKGNKGGKK